MCFGGVLLNISYTHSIIQKACVTWTEGKWNEVMSKDMKYLHENQMYDLVKSLINLDPLDKDSIKCCIKNYDKIPSIVSN